VNLHRISKDLFSDHNETREDFWLNGDQVCLDFRNFTARDQGSHFRATFDWSDVEALIRIFADANHSEAVLLTQARKVASSIADLMKISN
jgi:hypothetical protein